MYEIRLSKRLQKYLDKLQKKVILNFAEKARIIAEAPYQAPKRVDVKPLKGKPKGFYRLRIGKHRFLYEIREAEILIYFYQADKRGDIY